MLQRLEKDVTPSIGLITFHTAVVKLLWNWNGEDPEKLFRCNVKKLSQIVTTRSGGYGQIQIEALVDCYLNLGKVYNNRGNYSGALQSYKRALDTATTSLGEQHERSSVYNPTSMH